MAADPGNPIAYMALEKGTPVFDSEGVEVGKIKQVLSVPEKDVFDGIVVDTGLAKTHFVDADYVGRLYERRAELKYTKVELEAQPEHELGTPVFKADADEESTTKGVFRRLKQG